MKKQTYFKLIFIAILVNGFHALAAQQSFLAQQQKYERVKTALTQKEQIVKDNLRKHGLSSDSIHVLIVAYKAEKQLEIFAKKKNAQAYESIAVYEICALSGNLGPKRKQGDGQIPEGFYQIDRFNPASNFYLSLGVNYPNLSDRRKSSAARLGGDIFIHGSCVTIGCLPVTDDKIKEIYLYAVFACNNGQTNIPVYIFPFRMTDANFSLYKNKYATNHELIYFWENLKMGYDKFVSTRKELKITINRNGDYECK